MFKRVLLMLAMMFASIGFAASPAMADDASEFAAGCEFTVPSLGSAAYSAHGVPVTITVGWQYTAGSWSACEDINVTPADGLTWNLMSPRKARTYMCSISNPSNCWYNAWRDLSYDGGVVATDMANGVKFQVHFAIGGYDGPHIQMRT